MAFLDQIGHLAIKKRQKQSANVRTVDVGIRHDNDRVVAKLCGVIIFFNAGAQAP